MGLHRAHNEYSVVFCLLNKTVVRVKQEIIIIIIIIIIFSTSKNLTHVVRFKNRVLYEIETVYINDDV